MGSSSLLQQGEDLNLRAEILHDRPFLESGELIRLISLRGTLGREVFVDDQMYLVSVSSDQSNPSCCNFNVRFSETMGFDCSVNLETGEIYQQNCPTGIDGIKKFLNYFKFVTDRTGQLERNYCDILARLAGKGRFNFQYSGFRFDVTITEAPLCAVLISANGSEVARLMVDVDKGTLRSSYCSLPFVRTLLEYMDVYCRI